MIRQFPAGFINGCDSLRVNPALVAKNEQPPQVAPHPPQVAPHPPPIADRRVRVHWPRPRLAKGSCTLAIKLMGMRMCCHLQELLNRC